MLVLAWRRSLRGLHRRPRSRLDKEHIMTRRTPTPAERLTTRQQWAKVASGHVVAPYLAPLMKAGEHLEGYEYPLRRARYAAAMAGRRQNLSSGPNRIHDRRWFRIRRLAKDLAYQYRLSTDADETNREWREYWPDYITAHPSHIYGNTDVYAVIDAQRSHGSALAFANSLRNTT